VHSCDDERLLNFGALQGEYNITLLIIKQKTANRCAEI